MTWEFVEDGIIVPNGRVYSLLSIGETGRVAVTFPNSDYEDYRYRCTIEFLTALDGVPVESAVYYRQDVYAKVSIVAPPSFDSEVDFTVVFGSRSLPFAGQVYALFREI